MGWSQKALLERFAVQIFVQISVAVDVPTQSHIYLERARVLRRMAEELMVNVDKLKARVNERLADHGVIAPWDY